MLEHIMEARRQSQRQEPTSEAHQTQLARDLAELMVEQGCNLDKWVGRWEVSTEPVAQICDPTQCCCPVGEITVSPALPAHAGASGSEGDEFEEPYNRLVFEGHARGVCEAGGPGGAEYSTEGWCPALASIVLTQEGPVQVLADALFFHAFKEGAEVDACGYQAYRVANAQ